MEIISEFTSKGLIKKEEQIEEKNPQKKLKGPRSGWDKSFQDMHKNCEDMLIINNGNDFDKDWDWKFK